MTCTKSHAAELKAQCPESWEAPYLCNKVMGANIAAKGRAAKHQAYTRAEYKPTDGFLSGVGETGACMLDKVMGLVDIIHALSNCRTW
jgi:hypothetical protein